MRIVEWSDKKSWNDFVRANSSPASFEQSWEWGEFKTELGEEVYRLAVVDDRGSSIHEDQIKAIVQIVRRDLPLGKKYFDTSRGPIVARDVDDQAYKDILELIKQDLGRKHGVFLRLSPSREDSDNARRILQETGFKRPGILIKTKPPAVTLLLDLGKSEEDLLQAMHEKTRYNIRLADRKGVKVRQSEARNQPPKTEEFYQLLKETAARQKIGILPKSHYENLLNIEGDVKTKLFLAFHENKPLAGAIIIVFGDSATYLHGASSGESKNLMAPYLLHWEIIKDAKRLGYQWYDWWGIAPSATIDNKQLTIGSHRSNVTGQMSHWSGITRFKRGFVGEETGREVNYLGTFDLPWQKFWYQGAGLMKRFIG